MPRSSLQEFLNKQQAEKRPPPPEDTGAHGFADEEPQIQTKRGLKISNSKSSIKEVPKIDDFRKRVNEILSQEDEQKKLAFELMSQFQNYLKDKTLDASKDANVRANELKSIENLIDFSRIINSDENQQEDLGTISLFITLYRALFSQRDRINELEYQQTKMAKEVGNLIRQVEKLVSLGK